MKEEPFTWVLYFIGITIGILLYNYIKDKFFSEEEDYTVQDLYTKLDDDSLQAMNDFITKTNNLNADMLKHIGSYLSDNDLSNLSQTSKEMRGNFQQNLSERGCYSRYDVNTEFSENSRNSRLAGSHDRYDSCGFRSS